MKTTKPSKKKFSALFTVTNLFASIDARPIVRGVSFSLAPGEIHVIMGPNGSGKSTLVQTLFGSPSIHVDKGSITMKGKSIMPLTTNERAQLGLFLGFQQPAEIPGVTLGSFLRAAKNALNAKRGLPHLAPVEFMELLKKHLKELSMDERFGGRSLNDGLSGGEKKKSELLQMMILGPQCAFLDEFDSGLDVDALRTICDAISRYAKEQGTAFLLVTHNPRINAMLKPTAVHIMMNGKIVANGGAELLNDVERHGFDRFAA